MESFTVYALNSVDNVEHLPIVIFLCLIGIDSSIRNFKINIRKIYNYKI